MKVIDCTPGKKEEGASRLLGDWKRALHLNGDWAEELKAQDEVIAHLHKVLNNSYFILRNVPLDEVDIPIPLVLVGPTGVSVLSTSSTRGVFRVKGSAWEGLDSRRKVYKNARPNLIARAALMARAVQKYLNRRGYELLTVEPVLIFTNPGIHIELIHPEVRVVLIDALDRFAAGLLQNRFVLDREAVQKMVDTLNVNAVEIEGEDILSFERDAFDFVDDTEVKRGAATVALNPERFDKISPYVDKMPFSTSQWLALALLIGVNVIILTALALLVLLAG